MTRLLFTTAFLLGAAAVVWMGTHFVDSNILGLAVITVIGAVYTIGVIELIQFRRATLTLSKLLLTTPESVTGDHSPLVEWLARLHPSLQAPVRLRIEGERVGLPAPVLVPYLVGLLVMLGLLGTFVGMVDTLKGAVTALEGTTKLEAIRAGLTAPIAGLSLAFGTSVAGVAASAMLGLMSTLSRRDRVLVARQLDSKINTDLRAFSRTHNQQETFKALQMQSQGLPEIADKLLLLATQMERMSEHLGERLTNNQESFHQSVKSTYAELASSIDKSLKASITESSQIAAESSRQAGENLQPIVQEAMTTIAADLHNSTQRTHQQLTQTVQEQLESLSGQFGQTSKDVSQAWTEGLSAHERANEALIHAMQTAFEAFNGQFKQATSATTEAVEQTTAQWFEQQQSADNARLEQWVDTLQQTQTVAARQLADTSSQITGELQQASDTQQTVFSKLTERFESMSSALNSQWQQSGEEASSRQQQLVESLEQVAQQITANAQNTSATMLSEINNLLKSSEELVQQRIASEQAWVSGHGERMDNLTATLQKALESLREEEERRSQAAVNRLAELESTVSTHLTTLGCALEEPMTRLIQTASETPRAAAEVIGQLRQEISKNIERDNSLLEERRRILEELSHYSASLEQTTASQLEAVEKLVNSSANMLEEVGVRFSDQVDVEVTKISQITDHFAGSATEMSSLGDAFGLAVTLYNESNGKLIDSLNRIEHALTQSTSRSDEQLGYYVAQAREVIDHSILSQKEIFEELRQLSQPEPAEVN